jgi:hypothetical protein
MEYSKKAKRFNKAELLGVAARAGVTEEKAEELWGLFKTFSY